LLVDRGKITTAEEFGRSSQKDNSTQIPTHRGVTNVSRNAALELNAAVSNTAACDLRQAGGITGNRQHLIERLDIDSPGIDNDNYVGAAIVPQSSVAFVLRRVIHERHFETPQNNRVPAGPREPI